MKHRATKAHWLRLIGPLLLVTLFGCQIGPGRLKSATSHYSDAVRIAVSEQLLVNLVRLRYRELPVFLGISSISTQFEFDTAVDVNGSTATGGGGGNVGAGGGVRYSERPTITFALQGGEEFQKRMLRPIDVVGISLVAESGWRGDRLLRITVEKMNGLKNAPTASGPTPADAPHYASFVEATDLIQKLSRQGLLDFEFETRTELLSAPLPVSQIDGEHTVAAVSAGVEFETLPDGRVQLASKTRTLVMRFRQGHYDSANAARLRELLRLERGPRRFDIVTLEDSTLDPFDPDQRVRELALDTRSLMGVLYFASNGVHVPEEHLEAGYATSTVHDDGTPFEWPDVLGDLLHIRSSDSWGRPSNAAVAVRHRGYWFYIADDDQSSKSTFTLLNQLFSLQAGEVREEKPVLTLPVGK